MTAPETREPGSSNPRDEGAVFAPVQVGRARSPRILASIVVVALGGLVAIGALDRLANAPVPEAAVIIADGPSAPSPAPSTRRDSRPPARGSLPTAPPTQHGRAIDTLMDLDVRPAGSHLFVHGDVFTFDIVRVRVKLEDAAGHVAAKTVVDLPGWSTAFLIGAVPRFDAHFFLPDEIQADGYTVAATAIGADGKALFTVARSVPRATVAM